MNTGKTLKDSHHHQDREFFTALASKELPTDTDELRFVRTMSSPEDQSMAFDKWIINEACSDSAVAA